MTKWVLALLLSASPALAQYQGGALRAHTHRDTSSGGIISQTSFQGINIDTLTVTSSVTFPSGLSFNGTSSTFTVLSASSMTADSIFVSTLTVLSSTTLNGTFWSKGSTIIENLLRIDGPVGQLTVPSGKLHSFTYGVTAGSFTTTGDVDAPRHKNSGGANGFNLRSQLTSTTSDYWNGGGLGYLDYTANTTTTTDSSNNIIIMSTLTVPANSFNRKGQELNITCRYLKSNDANRTTHRLLFNNAGTYTAVSSATSNNQFIQPLTQKVELTWTSASLWIRSLLEWHGGSMLGGVSVPSPLFTFDETKTMTFNCACNSDMGNSIVGQCNFLDMRIEWGGM